MASSFKAYMAGVGTVAVAVVLGFGGGVLIAQRFASDTAVQEQSKIAKAKQDTKQAEASKQAETPQFPAAKPVVTETVGAAFTNQPLSAAPQMSASPNQTEPAQVASSLQPSNQDQPHTQAVQEKQTPRVVETSPAARETVRDVEPTPTQQEQIAVERAAPPPPPPSQTKRKAERTVPKPEHKPQPKAESQKTVENEFDAAPDAPAVESTVTSRREKRREQSARAQQNRIQDSEARRAQVRAIVEEEEIEELSSRSEEPMEYRRTAPAPLPLPFLGLFAR